jgi:hypothetical protein
MATCSLVRSALNRFVGVYQHVQVSHRGKYSVERLLALQEYTQSASTFRVLLVCFLTPLPMLVIALGLEAIPLQNPSEGWRANSGMWIRVAVALAVGTSSISNQARLLVPGIDIRPIHSIAIGIVVSALYTAASVAVAALWVFPIPFMIVVMYGPFMVALVVSFFIVVARCSLQSLLQSETDLKMLERFSRFLSAQTLLGIVYPAYTIMFIRLASAGYELMALMILPVIRMIMQNLVAYSSSHLEDLIPAAAIFTVELFNSLYLAATMQRVTALYSVLVVLAIDAGKILFALHGLRGEMTSLATVFAQLDTASDHIGVSRPNVLFGMANCAVAVARSATIESPLNIQLRSCVKHKLSLAVIRQLAGLEQHDNFTTSLFGRERPRRADNTAIPGKPRLLSLLMRSTSVVPAPEGIPVAAFVLEDSDQGKNPPPSLPINQPDQANTAEVLRQLDQTLQVAFTIEYTALSEYLESVMPIMYVVYISLLMKLSSRQYHMELVGISESTLERSTINTFLYGLMEIASFVLLVLLLRRVVRLNALHVVAFVLETQMSLVQGMLVTWMIIAQQFQVEHWGASQLRSVVGWANSSPCL